MKRAAAASVLEDWIASTMNALGYWGVGHLMFLENVFPPIPSELIMPLAGFAAGSGEMSFVGVVASSAAGSVAGQYPLSYLGRSVGREGLHRFADQYGKWVADSGQDVDLAGRWLNRHGAMAVFVCRLIPGQRSLISIPAAASDISLAAFTGFSAAGICLWSSLLTALGYLLGGNYRQVMEFLGPMGNLLWIVLVAALIGWIAFRVWSCWRRARTDCPLREHD